MATHSSVLSWRIPGMGEPGGLPSMGSHRVGHDWGDLAAAAGMDQTLCFSEQLQVAGSTISEMEVEMLGELVQSHTAWIWKGKDGNSVWLQSSDMNDWGPCWNRTCFEGMFFGPLVICNVLFNFHIFVNLSGYFLWLISSFILLCQGSYSV